MAKEGYSYGSGPAPSKPPFGKAGPDKPLADKVSAEKERQREVPAKPAPEKRLSQSKSGGQATKRLISLDAYRGLIMLLMASGGFGFVAMAKASPDSVWSVIATQFDHVAWQGCAIWDLIQPAFMFMVGVALPYSYANRRSRGDSYRKAFLHALWRSAVLVVLGVFLASQPPHQQINFVFTNVLAQIGLGYMFVFLLVNQWKWLQTLVLLAILGSYGYLFYSHPLPGPDVAPASLGAKSDDLLPGIQGHWSKHLNFAADVDRKLLNLFPRPKLFAKDEPQPYVSNEGGYQTLNFIPSIATMILGLMAGELLRSGRTPRAKFFWLLGGGAVCLVAGLALGFTVCPIVKRIWTPSWVFFSGGCVLWILAVLYGIIDVGGWQRWTFPLVVVGTNSIVMYMMSQMMKPWVATNLKITFGQTLFSGTYGPILQGFLVLLVFWLICLWLYLQKIFVKI